MLEYPYMNTPESFPQEVTRNQFDRRDEQYAQLIYGTFDPESDKRVVSDTILEGIKTYGEAVKRGEFDGLEYDGMKSLEHTLSLIPPEGRVIDIGAGTGAATRLFLPELIQKNATIDAFDLVYELMLEFKTMAKEVNEETGRHIIGQFWNASYYDIKGPSGESLSNTYDFAISNFALNYAEKLDQALKEIARILKPGGTFLFSSVVIKNPYMRYNKIPAIIGEKDTGVEVMAFKYTEEDILRMLNDSGLIPLSTPEGETMMKFNPPYYHPILSPGEEASTFVMACRKEIR